MITSPLSLDELEKEIAEARRIVVLGVGNPNRGDDGAGIAVVRGLIRAQSALSPTSKSLPAGKNRSVRIVQGFETPESATGEIRAFGPDLVVLVDAAVGPYPPGTPFIVLPEEIVDESPSTHRIPLSLLVRYLQESVGCRTIVLGIQPKSVQDGQRLSRPVRAAVSALVDRLSKTLFSADV